MRLIFLIICAVLLQGCATTEVSNAEQRSARTQNVIGPVYDMDALTIEPVPIHRTVPRYPKWERRNEISVNVVVEFVITKEGKTARITVLESPSESFSDSVVWAVEDWEFRPGEIDGQPVNCLKRQAIPFKYNRR